MLWIILSVLVQKTFGAGIDQGWNYINLHCRDNHNYPVDWWFIYKPPGKIIPFLEGGHNFSYIASNDPTRWQLSEHHITSNSMLQYTMWPMFRSTYKGRLAYVVYDERKGGPNNSSSTLGVLMADELGGVWLGHTVPGFPDMSRSYPVFPEAEAPNGHLMHCLSLDLVTVNEIAITLKYAQPEVVSIRIPSRMKSFVPAWNYLIKDLKVFRKSENKKWAIRENFDFVSRGQSVHASVLVRHPGQTHCLYQEFARQRQIVLDVYGHGDGTHASTLCTDKYSLRNIKSISLKLEESVSYIPTRTDHARFAVSTAAHWQTRGGAGSTQYWICISSLQSEDKEGEGGIMYCVENFNIWRNFDNLKVSEPQC